MLYTNKKIQPTQLFNLKRILQRTTILQLVELEELASGRRLVMANTHLYFHPNADHIRLVQSIAGLRLAQHLASNSKDQGNLDGAALVFCGDFNSCPGSGVFELMTLQRIDEDNEAWSSSKYFSVFFTLTFLVECFTTG